MIVGNNLLNANYLTCVYNSDGSDLFCDDEKHFYSVNSTPEKPSEVPGFSSASITKEGWLTKRGQKFKTCKKRWFVYDGTFLRYYKKQVS